MITDNPTKTETTAECLRCGRKLKNMKQIQLGYGATCYKRLIDEPIEGQVTVDQCLDDREAVSSG